MLCWVQTGGIVAVQFFPTANQVQQDHVGVWLRIPPRVLRAKEPCFKDTCQAEM